MKNKNKIKNLAKEIALLEQECEQGINVSENLKKMEEIMIELPFEDLLKLNCEIEKNFLTN